MSPNEHRVRTLVLAQALDSGDGPASLLDDAARKQALHAGLMVTATSLSSGSASSPSDIDRLHAYAQKVVESVSVRHSALGAFVRARWFWGWLSVGLPLLALVAGMATDRMANPHRVDLLSMPLLMVVIWNLTMYCLLGVTAFMHQPPWLTPLIAKVTAWVSHIGTRPRGETAKVATRFYAHWHRITFTLTSYRLKTVLHLAAAAWGLGIAASLAGRGLFVQYQIGWESTFLDAKAVHALLEVIFWLPATIANLTPLTLAEVAAMRNFETDGVAGARWVWMYVGLMLLFVVLPRLLLAAWATGRARAASRQLGVDLETPYFQNLLASMRRIRLKIGLSFADARQGHGFLRLVRVGADDPLAQQLAISTPEGDLLEWVEEPGAGPPVDCVLSMAESELPHPQMPTAWSGRPLVFVPEYRMSSAWHQWPILLRALAAGLGSQPEAGWTRLGIKLQQQEQLRVERSMAAVAACLSKMAMNIRGENSESVIRAALDELFLVLQQLHRMDQATGRELEVTLVGNYASPSVMGKRSGTAAGAATGATAGVAVDASVGFVTLGAGAALGALLGAGLGWITARQRKKGADADLMQRLTEAALLLYMEFSNSVRVLPGAGTLRTTWQSAITHEIQQRKKRFLALWSAADKTMTAQTEADAIPVLVETVQAIVAALYPPAASVEIIAPSVKF